MLLILDTHMRNYQIEPNNGKRYEEVTLEKMQIMAELFNTAMEDFINENVGQEI